MNYHHVDRNDKQPGEKHHVDATVNLLIAILLIAFMGLLLVSPTG
jgi:hypothetical protein